MAAPLTLSPLAPRCGYCRKAGDLMRCARCKVVLYCCQEHQRRAYSTHKPACSLVAKSKNLLDEEEGDLRRVPGDMFIPANPFETCVGHFWGISDTRDYMRARYGVIDALSDIHTYESVQLQLDHAVDMLRLCRSDNMGIRDLVPPLFLRLNRDQECYDFIKWWGTTGSDSHYDYGDMSLGYLDIHGSDVFESANDLAHEYSDLGMTNVLILLKIRLLLDLRSLKNSTTVSRLQTIPREIFDAIRLLLPTTSIVSQSKALLQRSDYTAEIRELERQIDSIYTSINKHNPHCWDILLCPGSLLGREERPGSYIRGSIEEAQIMLRYSYYAWAESPGALSFIMAKHNRSKNR